MWEGAIFLSPTLPHSHTPNDAILAFTKPIYMKKSTTQQLDKLDRQLESLLSELSSYSEAQLNQKPAPGAWSAMQVMHHMLLAEQLSLAYVQKKLSFNPALKNAGVTGAWHVFLLWTFIYAPLKFKAPANVSDEKLPAHSTLKETAQIWKNNRRELREYLDTLPDGIFQKLIYRHPFAGLLSLDAMLLFFEWHFLRHHKQIHRTVK